jgi:hypothetical protein
MENRKVKQVLSGVGTSGKGDIIRKACRGLIWWEYYVLMYENRKMRPVETISGMGGGRIKENDVRSEFNYDIL